MTDEQLNDMLSISFLATFATCAPRRASCRPILHRWHTGRERGAHYAAAKGAVLAFTKSLAEELAPAIRVNAASPVDTALARPVLAEKGDEFHSEIPMRRLRTADEVAQALAFLCSDWASYITGQTLHVNGGLYVPG